MLRSRVEDLAQRQRLRRRRSCGRERAVEVGLGEAVELGIELRQARPRQAERIDLGDHVAAHAVGADQLVDAVLPHGDVGNAVERDRAAGSVAVQAVFSVAVARARARIEDARGRERGADLRRATERIVLLDLGEVALIVGRHAARVAQVVGVQAFQEHQTQSVRIGLGAFLVHGDLAAQDSPRDRENRPNAAGYRPRADLQLALK